MQHPGDELLRSYHKILGKRIVNALKSFENAKTFPHVEPLFCQLYTLLGPDLVVVSDNGTNSFHFELRKSFDIINSIPVHGEKVLYMI